MALRGVRVLELSYLLPGPFATILLSDLGADVIKVEDPRGDGMRGAPLLPPFDALNRGKKSIVLDLKTDGGVKSLYALCKTCDVLVQGYRPGVLERLGVGIATLRRLCPHLIVCSITGYGLTGPRSMRAGHDLNYLSRSGVLGMSRVPGVPPTQIADIASGSYPAVIQILAALIARNSNGGMGCVIDVSMVDNSYALLGVPRAMESVVGEGAMSGGKFILCGAVPCYDVYPCRGGAGYVSVACLEKKFWIAFIDAVGLPQSLHSQGMSPSPKVKSQVAEVIRSKAREEWRVFFETRDLMCEVVLTPSEASVELLERMPPVMVGKGTEVVRVVRTPLRMDGGMVHFRTEPAPKLGEHTDEILSKL